AAGGRHRRRPTTLVLPRGQWTEVVAQRVNGVVTVRVGTQTTTVGSIPVNPVGGTFASIERTSVGGDGTYNSPTGVFHGAIRLVSLYTPTYAWIEQWRFVGSGTSV